MGQERVDQIPLTILQGEESSEATEVLREAEELSGYFLEPLSASLSQTSDNLIGKTLSGLRERSRGTVHLH